MNFFSEGYTKTKQQIRISKILSSVISIENKNRIRIWVAGLVTSGFFTWYHLENFIDRNEKEDDLSTDLIEWLRDLFDIKVLITNFSNVDKKRIKQAISNDLDNNISSTLIKSKFLAKEY